MKGTTIREGSLVNQKRREGGAVNPKRKSVEGVDLGKKGSRSGLLIESLGLIAKNGHEFSTEGREGKGQGNRRIEVQHVSR